MNFQDKKIQKSLQSIQKELLQVEQKLLWRSSDNPVLLCDATNRSLCLVVESDQ